ncbi:hypothetical protein F3D3_2924 [Fusibacter sp. 3D3]|nr:hypothetical protein F3D3_2924 [Fusibacter sp. 3D3]
MACGSVAEQIYAAGRIFGRTRFGRSWCIPTDAQKPTDPRKILRQQTEAGGEKK